ncbi:MAG: hypothetical protein ACRDOJ_05065 [Nocardioidaceae bacterium]
MKYRKKPVVIEAMRIDAEDDSRSTGVLDPNRRAVAEASGWMLAHDFNVFRVVGDGPFGIAIQTLEGEMTAAPGDWIIRGVQGEFYPCKPDIFEATYERAVDVCPSWDSGEHQFVQYRDGRPPRCNCGAWQEMVKIARPGPVPSRMRHV